MMIVIKKENGGVKSMTRKFKSGDRVKTKPSPWLNRFFTVGVDYVGTVVDYYAEGDILVKFDNLDIGHNGDDYYSGKDINYDPYNRQHLYVYEDDLCLLEGEE